MSKTKEPPLNSYLITCFRNWIIDCNMRPYIQVDVNQLNDPMLVGRANNGVLTLNISPASTDSYHLDHEGMSFNARFNGTPHHIYLPLSSIMMVTVAPDEDQTKCFVLPALPITVAKPAVKLEVVSEHPSSTEKVVSIIRPTKK